MKRIVLVLPYFGKFKNYFSLWLNSCENNPTIDWLIFTDQKLKISLPSNIYVNYLSFEEFKSKLQTIFDFKISLDKPYKLCDYKPTYGLALKEELKNYDFWGYCDCDLIFGNIRKFVTEELLNKYDKLFMLGHFGLYRNTEKVNSFFKNQKYYPYKQVLQNPKNCTFDEWAGLSHAWDLSGLDYYDGLDYDDIDEFDGFKITKQNSGWGNPYHRKNDISVAKQYRKMKNIIYHYNKDSLYRIYRVKKNIRSQEILYLHFQKRNMSIDENLDKNNFLVVPNAFKVPLQLNINNLKKLNSNSLTIKNMVIHLKSIVHSILGR